MTGRPALGSLARIVKNRFLDDRCVQIASSLTFTTLLSIVPLITVALTLISAFPVFGKMSEALHRFVLENMVPESADTIATYTQQFAANAARLTVVGLVFLGVTAIMLMVTIERAFNQIWRVSRPRALIQRVLIYWTLLTVGPVLIGASLSLTSWLVTVSLGLVGNIPGAGIGLLKVVPAVLTALAMALLYVTMPNRRVRFRDALLGGLVAGILFEAMKRGFAVYITHFPTYKLIYGAFASVPIFLLWVYLSWLIVLFGAVIVAAMPEWRAQAGIRPEVPGTNFLEALRILHILWRAHRTGEVVGLRSLHVAVQAPIDRIEAVLDAMVGEAWVSRALPTGWVLNRDPRAITLDDVYRRFVFQTDKCGHLAENNAALEALIRDISLRMTENMQTSIEELFQATTAETVTAPSDRSAAP